MRRTIFRTMLRTLDVDAADSFYSHVLGTKPVGTVRLHEQALARGARPHWLGFLEVGDVDQAAAAFLERGATSLAPKWVNPEGVEAAVMRDAGGAIIALAKPPPVARTEEGPAVAMHVLNTTDVTRAMKTYGELFEWQFSAPLQLAGVGAIHPFSFEAGAAQAGVFVGIEGRPQVHPHWLFHFRVADLEVAMARVKERGGVALEPIQLPSGGRAVACDDPQGAAFGLVS